MKHVHSETEKAALVSRIRKIGGQLRAIERMIEEDEGCSEILMQVLSARQGLRSLGQKVLREHIHTCIEHAETPKESEENLKELMKVLDRYVS
ncbi:MAG: metal-sensitive transcriptional regulator [Candidatus Methylacidiphilales bacterium]